MRSAAISTPEPTCLKAVVEEMKTHSQEFSNRHLLLLVAAIHISKRSELHCWWSGRHEHHGEPEHRVVGKPISTSSDSVDNGN